MTEKREPTEGSYLVAKRDCWVREKVKDGDTLFEFWTGKPPDLVKTDDTRIIDIDLQKGDGLQLILDTGKDMCEEVADKFPDFFTHITR